MFFDDVKQIPEIAARVGCAIFAVGPETQINLKFALKLEPATDKKTRVISVEQVREFIALAQNKETRDRFFVITEADAMNEAAQNAFLKTLEEPGEFCHFVLLTTRPDALLPTIRSRAQIFYPKKPRVLSAAPDVDAKILALAKRLISARGGDLFELATEISKMKPTPREVALESAAVAIELLYKSYFKTGDAKWLARAQDFLKLHDALRQNGHIKLQIAANLV